MCPHCGRLVADMPPPAKPTSLVPYHDAGPMIRMLCPGSQQNPRCAESDGRPLWNGNPNPHFYRNKEAVDA